MGTEDQQSGVSRRDLMKKGAVAGGIAWSAPILLSANDVAGAQTGDGSPPPSGACTQWYRGMYETGDDPTRADHGTCKASWGAQGCFPDRSYESACGTGTVISAGRDQIVLHDQLGGTGAPIKNVAGFTRGGKLGETDASGNRLDCGRASAVHDPAAGTWTLTFPHSTPNGGGFSNIQFVFCV